MDEIFEEAYGEVLGNNPAFLRIKEFELFLVTLHTIHAVMGFVKEFDKISPKDFQKDGKQKRESLILERFQALIRCTDVFNPKIAIDQVQYCCSENIKSNLYSRLNAMIDGQFEFLASLETMYISDLIATFVKLVQDPLITFKEETPDPDGRIPFLVCYLIREIDGMKLKTTMYWRDQANLKIKEISEERMKNKQAVRKAKAMMLRFKKAKIQPADDEYEQLVLEDEIQRKTCCVYHKLKILFEDHMTHTRSALEYTKPSMDTLMVFESIARRVLIFMQMPNGLRYYLYYEKFKFLMELLRNQAKKLEYEQLMTVYEDFEVLHENKDPPFTLTGMHPGLSTRDLYELCVREPKTLTTPMRDGFRAMCNLLKNELDSRSELHALKLTKKIPEDDDNCSVEGRVTKCAKGILLEDPDFANTNPFRLRAKSLLCDENNFTVTRPESNIQYWEENIPEEERDRKPTPLHW